MKFLYDRALTSEREIKKHGKSLTAYLNELRALCERGGYDAPESALNLPFDEKDLEEVQNLAAEKFSKNLKYFLVIGIGGSSLGAQAIYEALHKFYDELEISHYPKLIFVDGTDPEFLTKLDFFLESRVNDESEILVNIISKSGSTTETIANAEFVLHDLKRRFPKIEDLIIVTTERNSKLWQLAEAKNIARLEIPQSIAGRFSVFSAVGLLPLRAANFEIHELLRGARDITNACLNDNLLENPAALSAIVSFKHAKYWRPIHDSFFFHQELESLGKWYRQLLAESVGKEKDLKGRKVYSGITPTVSIGPIDLHSIGQLHLGGPQDKFTTFISSERLNSVPLIPRDRIFPELNEYLTGRRLNEITQAILTAAKNDYERRGLPFMEVILPDINAYSLGQFMQWKMIEVMLIAKLFNVNAFDQPNVEAYKEETKKIISSKPAQNGEAAAWPETAVVYQIYPRSFKDTNGDGVGDLEGIIEKLDYLNDGTENSLGIDAIWINPVYRSPQKDFGYDVSDYYSVDPVFGNLETFLRLAHEARLRNIKIIMDFVPNHTSVEHPWFIESRSSKSNPKRDWYIWRDPKSDGSPPNNWLSVFGGPAWTFDPTTKQYYLHSFLADQPDLNWRHPEVKAEMTQVLKFWIHHGADGFRTDAVYHLIKDSQFRDDPPNPNFVPNRDDPYNRLLHIYSTGQPELLETAGAFCEVLGYHGNTFMVSEAYLDVPSMEKLYKACDTKLHAPLNFNLMNLEWDALAYKRFLEEFHKSLNGTRVPNYVLGNHDRPRIASRLSPERARVAAMISLALRGMSFIYYGEELGMENVPIETSKSLDQWSKSAADSKYSRDPERTPMQWSNDLNAGFGEAEPWLPVSKNYKKINVAEEARDPKSMLNFYKKLIHFRKKSEAILTGSYKSVDAKNSRVFAFAREAPKEKILVAANFTDTDQKCDFDELKKGTLICTTFMDRGAGEKIALKNFTLRPNEGCVIKL